MNDFSRFSLSEDSPLCGDDDRECCDDDDDDPERPYEGRLTRRSGSARLSLRGRALAHRKRGKGALRTIRDLRCVLAHARRIRAGVGQDGHVDELGLEVFEHHVVLAAAFAIGPPDLVRFDLVVDRHAPVYSRLLLHDRPTVLGRRWRDDRVPVGRV